MDFVTADLSLCLSLIHIYNGKPHRDRTEGDPMVDDAFVCRDRGWDEGDQPGRQRGAQDRGKDRRLDIKACCLAKLSEAIHAEEMQCWGMFLLQKMKAGALCISVCPYSKTDCSTLIYTPAKKTGFELGQCKNPSLDGRRIQTRHCEWKA